MTPGVAPASEIAFPATPAAYAARSAAVIGPRFAPPISAAPCAVIPLPPPPATAFPAAAPASNAPTPAAATIPASGPNNAPPAKPAPAIFSMTASAPLLPCERTMRSTATVSPAMRFNAPRFVRSPPLRASAPARPVPADFDPTRSESGPIHRANVVPTLSARRSSSVCFQPPVTLSTPSMIVWAVLRPVFKPSTAPLTASTAFPPSFRCDTQSASARRFFVRVGRSAVPISIWSVWTAFCNAATAPL